MKRYHRIMVSYHLLMLRSCINEGMRERIRKRIEYHERKARGSSFG